MHTSVQSALSDRHPLSDRPAASIPVPLRYPAHWWAPRNPRAFEAEHHTAVWLRGLELIHDERSATLFRKLDVAGYGGWPYPMASLEHLETVTRFLTLWIFYDDGIEGSGEQEEARLEAAVRGEPDRIDERTGAYRGWWDLGRRCRHMSPAWRRRHAARFRDWLRSVRLEAGHAARIARAGLFSSTVDYMNVRRTNIGMLPMIDFIEYMTGRELPVSIRNRPVFQAIETAAADAVVFINDLYGFTKDLEARWPNVVSCLAQESGLPPGEAWRCVAAMHNQRVRTLGALEAELLAEVEDRETLERWLMHLHHIVRGFAHWHESAPRYSRSFDTGSGERLSLVIEYPDALSSVEIVAG